MLDLNGAYVWLETAKNSKIDAGLEFINDLINQVELAQQRLNVQSGLTDPHVLFETGKDLTLAATIFLTFDQSTVTDEEIKTAYESCQ